jgi:prevent-host-death family protein
MLVTATDFKMNLGHFLNESQESTIVITKNGQPYARLTGLTQAREDTFTSLRGILPNTVDLTDVKESRMRAHENHI